MSDELGPDRVRVVMTTRRQVLTGTAGMMATAAESAVASGERAASVSTAARVVPIDIKRSGSQASEKGLAEYFTGAVRIDGRFSGSAPARAAGATVTFEPGARTVWHTHPVGQTLIVTFGVGWVQREGGPIEEIRPGDIVWFAPGEKHWDGATPTSAMTYIAIAESLDGKSVDWMEQVSDEQYRK